MHCFITQLFIKPPAAHQSDDRHRQQAALEGDAAADILAAAVNGLIVIGQPDQ